MALIRFYNGLSPATRLVLQSFFSVLGSVLVGVLAAAYQSYTQAGHLDLQALLNVCLLTFALLFGKTMHDWVPNHAQQLIQAYRESEAQLKDALARQQNVAAAVVAAQSKQGASTGGASSPATPPPLIIQNSSPITPEHVQAISQQIAVNLATLAAPSPPASPPPPPPVAPSSPLSQQSFPPIANLSALDTIPVAVVSPVRNWNESQVLPTVQAEQP